MVKAIDKERIYGKLKQNNSIIQFFTGAGTGIVISCFLSPDSLRKTIVIFVGIAMIVIGWYKQVKQDKIIMKYLEKEDDTDLNF